MPQPKSIPSVSVKTELGVKFYCYGEFKCLACQRSWDSGSAWRDFGQECRTCHVNIKAHHIEEAYRYVCKECQIVWRWKWADEGNACPKCGEIKKTSKNHAVVTRYIKANLKPSGTATKTDEDKKRSHDTKLCEKCCILGKDCRSSQNLSVSEVMEIAAKQRQPLPVLFSSSSRIPSIQPFAPTSFIATSLPVINTADTFKKVTPAISYSSIVSGRNPVETRAIVIPAPNHNTITSTIIPNGCAELNNVPATKTSASEAIITKEQEEDDYDVYGNLAWAAAYKLEQEEKSKNASFPTSARASTNGKTRNGNGYYFISVPTNHYQQGNSWGCGIL